MIFKKDIEQLTVFLI